MVARHLAFVGLCVWALWQSAYPWLWPIAAVLQGFNLLGFLILVHEQVHKAIFAKSRPRLEYLLGLLYALPTGISVSQFTRWHLDHHEELGHAEHDPKRAHLSPKKNSRWLKLLYLTPALFVIYARASRKEAATYAPGAPETHPKGTPTEPGRASFGHGLLLFFGGGWVLLRVHTIPVFFCFPPIFVLNRLGQHYDIDTSDPAKWSTLVHGNPVWHFLFLWSNFHIEHHYYQRIPFYNLKTLNPQIAGLLRQNPAQKPLLHGHAMGLVCAQQRSPHRLGGLSGPSSRSSGSPNYVSYKKACPVTGQAFSLQAR